MKYFGTQTIRKEENMTTFDIWKWWIEEINLTEHGSSVLIHSKKVRRR